MHKQCFKKMPTVTSVSYFYVKVTLKIHMDSNCGQRVGAVTLHVLNWFRRLKVLENLGRKNAYSEHPFPGRNMVFQEHELLVPSPIRWPQQPAHKTAIPRQALEMPARSLRATLPFASCHQYSGHPGLVSSRKSRGYKTCTLPCKTARLAVLCCKHED